MDNYKIHLVKAKQVRNGKWIEGYILEDNDLLPGTYVCPKLTTTCREDGKMLMGEFIAVDPDTVCRCAGRSDKNGKTMFENDILKLKDYHGWRTVYLFWSKDHLCWFYGGDGFSDEYFFNSEASTREVCGNTIDGPSFFEEN